MVRAAKILRAALTLSHDRRTLMTADVEKSAKHIVTASDNQNRLSSYLSSDVLSPLANLIGASDCLPRPAEDHPLLQFENARICVPRGRRRACLT